MFQVVPQRYQELREVLKGIVVADILTVEDPDPRVRYGFYGLPDKWMAQLEYDLRLPYYYHYQTLTKKFALYFHKEVEKVYFKASLVSYKVHGANVGRLNNLSADLSKMLKGPHAIYTALTAVDTPAIRKLDEMGDNDCIKGMLLPEDDDKVFELFTRIRACNTEEGAS